MSPKILFLFFFIFLVVGCVSEQSPPSSSNSQSLEVKNQTNSNITNNSELSNIKEQRSKVIENTNQSNLDICELENNTDSKLYCYISNAIKLDDPTICYLIDYGENFFLCLKEWCSKTNKKTLSDCEKYFDASKRLICLNNCLNQER